MVSINKIARTGVLGALLMGSVALKATNPIKNVNKTPNQNQTEIVSKEGAEALKSMSLQNVQQTNVPTVNNPKLDATLRKFAQDENSAQTINDALKIAYKNNGTFLGSALVQHDINIQHIVLFLEWNTDVLIKNNINPELGKEIKGYGEDFYKSVKPNKDSMYKWLTESYLPKTNSFLQFDHIPNADEVLDRLDYIAEKKCGFDLDDMINYFNSCDIFRQHKLKNRTDIQAKSDMAAFKMFMIDKMMIKKSLKNNGVFLVNAFHLKKERKDMSDFYEDWMKSVEPTGN